MTINRIDERVTAVTFSRDELHAFGVSAARFSPRDRNGADLLRFLWNALDRFCGMRRDGNVTFLEYRPYIHGGCRFCVGFTGLTGTRVYSFARADDLLDALIVLRRGGMTAQAYTVERAGSRFLLTLPPDARISRHTLTLLSEYSLEEPP